MNFSWITIFTLLNHSLSKPHIKNTFKNIFFFIRQIQPNLMVFWRIISKLTYYKFEKKIKKKISDDDK